MQHANGRPGRLEEELGLSMARLVILKAEDPEAPADGWTPVDPEAVPDWIRLDPAVVAALMRGNVAHVALDPTWYRAIVLPSDLPGCEDARQ